MASRGNRKPDPIKQGKFKERMPWPEPEPFSVRMSSPLVDAGNGQTLHRRAYAQKQKDQ